MNTVHFHLRVRNDDHCPICRMWYLTPSFREEEVDEWVRRSNGDKYQTINVDTGIQYKLFQRELDSEYTQNR